MGDDPYIPLSAVSGNGSSNASNYFISNIGRPSVVIMVVGIGLSLGMSIGTVVTMVVMQLSYRSQVTAQIEAVERRAMDRANIAEREARIAQDKYTYVQGELAKKGIYITTDGH